MPKVRFLPIDLECDVSRGVTLLKAALSSRVGMKWFCGGQALCGTCMVVVARGQGNLAEPTPRERFMLEGWGIMAGARLGCQARVKGDVTVIPCDAFQHEREEVASYLGTLDRGVAHAAASDPS